MLTDQSSTANHSDPLPLRFEAETMAAAAAVREALGALVAEVPGEIRKPRELQRALGVDYKICWQVFNVIQAGDPLKAAKFTPSAPALKRLLASSLSIGVKESRVEAVQSAIAQFASVVHKHAEDRPTFQAMVAAASEGDDAASELPHRRTAYRAMSQIWGAQVETHHSISFVRRSASGDRFDGCAITIKRGFHRLHTGGSPIVFGSRVGSQGSDSNQFIRVPLDSEAAKLYQAPLLPEFSSAQLPKLRSEAAGGNWVYTKLADEGIGKQARVNLAFGVAHIGLPMTRDAQGRYVFQTSSVIRTPTGLLVLDVLVHRPSFGAVSPSMEIFQSLPEDPSGSEAAPRLRAYERIERFGSADLATDAPDFPGYSRLLQFAAGQMKWNLAEFEIMRLRVEYPVMGSAVRVEFNV